MQSGGADDAGKGLPGLVTELETRRLILRPLELADAEQTQQIFPHWGVVKFLASRVPWPYPADGALTHYRHSALPAMARGEEWHWSVRLKIDPNQLIGAVSLIQGADHNRGFWLGEAWQGKGLMTEAADAVTDFWFNELGFSILRVPKAAANTASRRISEKQGMRVIAVEEREYVCGRLSTEIWEITSEEWRRYRHGQ